MPETRGQSNPNWTREETILAMELLVRNGMRQPPHDDPRVLALSELLRSCAIHPNEKKGPSFRTPDSIRLKTDNLRSCAEVDRKGLTTSRMDRSVWSEFHTNSAELHAEASRIRRDLDLLSPGSADPLPDAESTDDDGSFSENGVRMRTHRQRERARGLRSRLIANLRKRYRVLCCEACGCEERMGLDTLAASEFEAHHREPLAASGEEARKTRVDDLSLLCASCHRLIHAVMRSEQRMVPVDEFRAILAEDGDRGEPG